MACTLAPCQPGTPPTWLLPPNATGEQFTVWATIEDLCNGCGQCEWRIDPTTYEVILTPEGEPEEPTGISYLDKLGEATMLVHAAARLRCPTQSFGLCLDTIPPMCSCRCAPCICGVRIDALELPSDTYSIVGVTINGIGLPQFIPAPTPAIATVPNPSIASVVAGPGPHDLTVTFAVGAVNGTSTSFTYDNNDGHGPREVAVVVSNVQSGATPTRVMGLPGTVHVITMPQRAQWRLDRQANSAWAVKLDPYADCHHTPGACGCSYAGGLSMGRWPNYQRIDLPDTLDCTWSITVLRGCPVSPLARRAVAELACKLTRECLRLPCDLPDNIARIVRGGVEVTFDDALKAAQTEDEKGFGVKAVQRYLDTIVCDPAPLVVLDPAQFVDLSTYSWPTQIGPGWR
jgi:hypothetical protein